MKKPALEHSTHPPGILTSADVLAGAVIPVRVRLSVTVRPPEPDAAQNATSVDAQLARHAPQLLAWAQQSPENARLLLTDPLEAAVRAKLKLSDAERRALAVQFDPVLPPGVELTGLDIKIAPPAKPAKVEKRKGDKQ
jgi:hypothetical protein